MQSAASSSRLLGNVMRTSSYRTCQLSARSRSVCLPPLIAASYTRAVPSLSVHAQSRRKFSSTHTPRAALASHPPSEPTELVCRPDEAALRELEDEDGDGPEVDLLPPEEAKLELTERAAEQLRAIATRENNPAAGLRIAVESGGCHGYQYKMELAKERNPDDYLFSHPTVKPSNVVIDAVSMSLMKGSVIDFATELIGSSFRIVENPQSKGSGCGCGVSWELKEV